MTTRYASPTSNNRAQFTQSSPTALLCAAATILFWAGSFPAITVALESFSPLPLAALRFGLASVTLVAVIGVVLVRAQGRYVWRRPTFRDLVWLALCGLLGIAIYNWLLNTGQQTVSPAAASFLIACQPVFAALVGTRIFGETFSRKAWIGTGICLAGALVLSLGQPGGMTFGGGSLLVLLAAVCSGSFFALQRPLAARYGALSSAFAVLLLGSLWLSPWIGSGLQELADASTGSIVALAFLGTLPGALAYVTWMVAIRDLGAAKASNLLFFMAPTAAILTIPVTGAWPNAATWVGGAIAMLGVLVVHRSKST